MQVGRIVREADTAMRQRKRRAYHAEGREVYHVSLAKYIMRGEAAYIIFFCVSDAKKRLSEESTTLSIEKPLPITDEP